MKKTWAAFIIFLIATGLADARKPLIGISTSFTDGRSAAKLRYSAVIEKAGGIPVLIPLTKDPVVAEETVRRVDGILFIGGADFDPALFGENVLNSSVEINGLCDTSDILLIRAALKYKKSILAICRGLQLLNISLGGNLYQDLPVQRPEGLPHADTTHAIFIDALSRLGNILVKAGIPVGKGDSGSFDEYITLTVNSFHHQAIKQAAPGLRVTAVAPDGVAEAAELPGRRFVVGVQFHPEIPASKGDPLWQQLFEAFVRSAK